MVTETDALRAQFERQCRGLDLSRNEDGVYTDEFAYVAWIHYQEGYAAAKAETAAAVAQERERAATVVYEKIDAVRKANPGRSGRINPAVAFALDALEDCAGVIRAGAKERDE